MKISTKGRYALRFMVYLAKHREEGVISLKDISINEEISLKYLEHIVSTLSKHQLIKSIRGAQGGYCLVKAPSEYKIGDILKAVEGDMCPVSCLEKNADTCPRYKDCSTIKFWQGLDSVIKDYIHAYTLEDFTNMNDNQYCDFVI